MTKKEVDVKTQGEFDKAIADGDIAVVRSGGFRAFGDAQVRASGRAQVWAFHSAQVRAFGDAQVWASGFAQVWAFDSARVWASGSAHVRAFGSAQVRAFDSAQVCASGRAHVWACDSAQIRAFGSAQVRASKHVAVTYSPSSGGVRVFGGKKIRLPKLRNASEWCAFYGVKVRRGTAILFKAVGDDYKSSHGTIYAPGSTPQATDWDGGKKECGGGLHFSPRPMLALAFGSDADAKRFVACPVKVAEIVVHPDGKLPEKVKAPRVCAPIWECDIDGNALR